MALNESRLRQIINDEAHRALLENDGGGKISKRGSSSGSKRGKNNLEEALHSYARLVESLSPRFRALVEGEGADDVEIESCEAVDHDDQGEEFVVTLETSGMMDGRPFKMREKTKISYDIKTDERGRDYVDVFAGGETFDHELVDGDESMMDEILDSSTYQDAVGECIESAAEDIRNDSDILDSFHDAEEESRDPYGYRGLSRSDF